MNEIYEAWQTLNWFLRACIVYLKHKGRYERAEKILRCRYVVDKTIMTLITGGYDDSKSNQITNRKS